MPMICFLAELSYLTIIWFGLLLLIIVLVFPFIFMCPDFEYLMLLYLYLRLGLLFLPVVARFIYRFLSYVQHTAEINPLPSANILIPHLSALIGIFICI